MITHVHDVNALSDERRRALAYDVWSEVNRNVFTSVSSTEFYEHFIGSESAVNKVQTMHGDDGAMIGYLNFRVANKSVSEQEYGVIRVVNCLLPEYRGKSSTRGFFLLELARYQLSQAWSRKPILLFFTANSPTSFYSVARYARRVYPNPHGETSDAESNLIKAVAGAFGLNVDDNFTITYDGLELHEAPQDTLGWKQHPHSAVQYYLQRCPRYRHGQSLAVVVPASVTDVLYGLAGVGYDRALKKVGIRKSEYRRWARTASGARD